MSHGGQTYYVFFSVCYFNNMCTCKGTLALKKINSFYTITNLSLKLSMLTNVTKFYIARKVDDMTMVINNF